MAKIKNMGTATMRFGEGAIISGSASNPDGSDSGYTLVISGALKMDNYVFPTSDGNANQVLTTDGAGNLSFQPAQTGSGAVSPGGLDRHVQFNDNGSFAGNYGILVDSNFNLKISGSIISKEAIGLGTDLGGGRNASDQWVAITAPEHKFHVIGDITEAATFSVDTAADSVGGSYWTFTKARGTPSSPAGVNTNDEIGRIQFFSHTGTSTLKRSALILAQADSDGDGRLKIYVTKEGDVDNVAIECYNNQVTIQDQMVIGSSGIIPISNGGASIGGASNRFDYIRANNLVAYTSLQLGGTHPVYDQAGFGLSINKNHLPIGNYTSGEGLVYISNSSAVENVIFALHKTGSHFGGIAINGTDANNDEKVVFFSENSTAGFIWKNAIPDNGVNGMGNLDSTGTTLMELDSAGNLDVKGNTVITGSSTVLGNTTIEGSLIASTIDTEGNLTLDANGGQIYMKDNGITYLTFNVDGTTDSIDATGHLKLNATADIYLNAQQGDIFFQDNGTTRMRIEDATGDISIGMGDTGPTYRLDVHDNTSTFVMNIENDYTSAGADLLRMKVNILNPSSTSALIYIYDSSNTGIYAVQGNGSGGSTVTTSFTAGHDTVIEKSINVIPGMIVESTGEAWYKPTDKTFETALPKVKLSNTNGSKKVFGVIAGYPEEPEAEQGWQHNGFTMRPAFPKYGQIAGVGDTEWNIGTMSIGEGCIWVTNINGEINNGDLIESSVILGHGRLQDDDIIRSKTVAKCTEDVNWNEVTETIEFEGIEYKKFLIACTFHCG